MGKFYLLVIVLLCVASCSFANQNSVSKLPNGSLSITTIPEIIVTSTLTKTFDGKGLEPWYDVAKSFIHTVQKEDLPYDDIKKADDGDFEVEEFLKGWELPFLVVFAIGFLFAIILPIVGFCFCCCRCCGKCGGEMVQKQSNKDGCKRAVFGAVLGIITILMFAGCLMAFVSNDRITDTVESLKTTPIAAIRDTEQYFNKTVTVVTSSLIGTVIDVLDIVVKDVIDLPSTIGNEVKEKLKGVVESPLQSVIELGKKTERMGELLANINSSTNDLQSKSQDLDAKIISVNINLTAIGQPNIHTEANYGVLPDVSNQSTNINNINNNNFTKKAEQGLGEFNNIDARIRNESNATTEKIRNETVSAKNEFKDQIEEDIVKEVNKLILNKTDGWIKDVEELWDDHIEPYDRYRWSAGVGLTCVLLLPVVLMALGLLCGIFGHDKDNEPTERGTISNMGGNFLMAATGFMFIFVFFLMLFTAICFVLGAHLEKSCYSLREETLYTDFLDSPKYWDGDYLLAKTIFDNGSLPLKIAKVLSDCRDNKAIYQAIQGDLKWDLDSKFSVKDKLGDFEKNLDGFNVSVNDQDILNNETKNNLRDLSKSGVNKIEFEKFFNETGKNVLNNASIIDDIKKNVNSSDITADLDNIQNKANEMKIISNQLEKDVRELQTLGGNISSLANETLVKAEGAEDKFSSTVNVNIGKIVSDEAKRLLGYTDDIADWAIKSVKHDLGQCKILTDVYDAAVNLVCRETVYPFNGYWFSVGFCLFFYIPAIIFCVKLAKHYRRMRFEEGFDKHDGVEMSHMGERNAVYPK
ncbi:prominin-1-like isoform X2 [Dendronephthya gigantea]|uniref:prominin-1-like isoform X2 n=1 Tax=Dendronephthya gigantea TaxID=151771 RepID=UPI00106CA7EA|nr:prominin-1-like isoform X2 [Dendronephthya gigantea]